MKKACYKTIIAVLIAFVVMNGLIGVKPIFASNDRTEQVQLDELYSELGSAIMYAKKSDYEAAQENVRTLQINWDKFPKENQFNKEEKRIEDVLVSLIPLLEKKEPDNDKIVSQLNALSKAIVAYENKLNPVDHVKEREKLNVLIPTIQRLDKAVEVNDFDEADLAYNELNQLWTANEIVVRNENVSAYGLIETKLAFIRIGLSQDPVDKVKIETASSELTKLIDDFIKGNIKEVQATDKHSLQEVIGLLKEANSQINAQEAEKASDALNEILTIWPLVEGEVRIRDADLYNKIENDIPVAIGKLQSKQVNYKKVSKQVTTLQDRLELIATKTEYTFIDAMLILLREGLEAILIVAGLIAFLKRANAKKGEQYVWGGAAIGFIASAILAIFMTVVFSGLAAAENRELLEGVIGIIAVVMMLTVGAWLHKRSNILNWNRYFEKNMGKAVATGSLVTIGFLSFLAIFREGAETIIFYIGMAPAIKLSQLVLGIVIALALLIIFGFVIIRYSTRIPLRPFFVCAAWVMYILSFKMIGASIHALQIANKLPTHIIEHIPFVQTLGIYPTVETIAPQIVLILIIIGTGIYIKQRAKRAKTA